MGVLAWACLHGRCAGLGLVAGWPAGSLLALGGGGGQPGRARRPSTRRPHARSHFWCVTHVTPVSQVAAKAITYTEETGEDPEERAIMQAAVCTSVMHPNVVCTYHYDM